MPASFSALETATFISLWMTNLFSALGIQNKRRKSRELLPKPVNNAKGAGPFRISL